LFDRYTESPDNKSFLHPGGYVIHIREVHPELNHHRPSPHLSGTPNYPKAEGKRIFLSASIGPLHPSSSLAILVNMTNQSEMVPLDIKHSGGPASDDPAVAETSPSEFYIDPAKERILLRKLDMFLTPVIMLVYLCCFLDRSNIGMGYLSFSQIP
jgi:hypothetical protein